MTGPGDEVVDLALDQLKAEFQDLDLKRKQKDRDAHVWSRETRWSRLIRWLKAHPGEEIELENIHSNAVQRLKKRYPGLMVAGKGHHYLPKPEGSPHKHGKKVCTLYLKWPEKPET